MSRTKFILILWLQAAIPQCAAVFIVVPNSAANVEGNEVGYDPFSAAVVQQTRYQQVYQASEFSAVPRGGAYITRVFFRPDCVKNVGFAVLTNTQVNLSTTPKQPDQLSAAFAANVGSNDTLVFGPKTFGVGAGGSPCPGAFSGEELSLENPFFYDPVECNLLMEVRFNGASYGTPGGFALDAVNSTNDAVSRIYARDENATMATFIDSVGLVTAFQFDPIPSLMDSITTNAVVITWPVQPKNFVLQWTDKIGSNANWQPYTDTIGGNALYHVLTLPRDSLQGTRFFRLACPSCPPIQ